MAGPTSPNFVKEFAYRTKINYYRILLEKAIEDEDEKAQKNIRYNIKRTTDIMSENKFPVSNQFEITQLINSLLGLLVFPESYYLDTLPKRANNRFDFPVLFECIERGPEYYSDTYKESDVNRFGEKGSAKNIVRHLRNAVAHEHVMIEPISGDVEGENTITDIVFHDIEIINNITDSKFYDVKMEALESYKGDNDFTVHEFRLKIPVENLENLFMEIADYLCKKGGTKKI